MKNQWLNKRNNKVELDGVLEFEIQDLINGCKVDSSCMKHQNGYMYVHITSSDESLFDRLAFLKVGTLHYDFKLVLNRKSKVVFLEAGKIEIIEVRTIYRNKPICKFVIKCEI
jgi:hypothetical protein